MRLPIFWTTEVFERAKVILGTSKNIHEAAAKMSLEYMRPVTVPALQTVFRDHGENAGLFLAVGMARSVAESRKRNTPASLVDPVMPTDVVVEPPLPPSPSPKPSVRAPMTHVSQSGSAAPSAHGARVSRAGSWAIALPDMHVPFHDVAAVDLVSFVVERITKLYRASLGEPEFILLGDYLDCLEVSKHRKDPELNMKFKVEIDRGVEMRIRLDSLAPWTAKTITLGNHENRLRNYITDNAPALEGIVPSIGDLLAMPANGWTVVPYGDVYKFGDLHITHDVDTAGMYAHVRSAAKMGGSTLIGHTHRVAVTHSGNYAHGPSTAAMLGWLGNFEFARYIKRPMRAEWRHGFGILYRDVSGHTHVSPIPIAGGRCVVGGTIYDLAEMSGRKAAA